MANRTGIQPSLRGDEIDEIADPATASSEDNANKLNEVIALLKQVGIAK